MGKSTVTTTRYMDPLCDYGFKRLFCSEPDKEILIALLNSLFEGEKKIVDLVYSPTEYVGETDEMQKVYFDLTCTGSDGEKFLIEMQRAEQYYFKDRAVFYLSRLVNEQFKKGETNWKNTGLKEVYLIGLLEFILKNNNSIHYLHNIALTNTNTGEIFYKKLGYKFIELPKFVKTPEELETEQDKWIYLLKNLSRMDKIPAVLNKRIFQRVFKIAEVSKLSKKQKEMYNASLKAKADYENGLAFAEKHALERGIELGAHNRAIEVVKEMLSAGESLEKIATYTKLSIAEIESIEKRF